MPQGTGGSGGDGGGGGGDGGSTTETTGTSFEDILRRILGGQTDGGTGGSSSGGSSGGSAGPAAPVDPNILQGARDYYSIWGTPAPIGYIEGLVKQGLNHFEIVEHELQKPRAQTTAFYRDKFAYYAAAAARIFGRR